MTEGVKKANSASSRDNEVSSGGNSKKKAKGEKFPTKVVVRKLPPSMNLESFLDNVSPLPDNDYINFVPADNSLFPLNYSRGYINFSNQEDLLIFTQKFDNYVFVDAKGHEYPALVEFAPFQRIPKVKTNKKKDSKCSTIEDDPHYIKFKERLLAEEEENESGKQNVFETTLPDDVPEKVTSTPLLDYLRKRREEKKRIREEKKEERKKRELERRKVKDEQRKAKKVASTVSTSVTASVPSDTYEPVETSAMNSASAGLKEKDRIKDKDPLGKRGAKDLLKAIKVKEKLNSISKDKEKSGKSYREERLRRIEQREELRKKSSKTGDSNETINQESGDKDKKIDNSSTHSQHDDKEEKYKKQKPKIDSFQKPRKKEFEKRSSEYYKGKKDFQSDKPKKKILVHKPQDGSSVSENKENNSNCDKGKEGKSEEAPEKQGAKLKSGIGSQDSVGKSAETEKKDKPSKDSDSLQKKSKSQDTSVKPSSSVKKKAENDKEQSKKTSESSTSLTNAKNSEDSSVKPLEHKKISKNQSSSLGNSTEGDISPVPKPERRRSLESQDPVQDSDSQSRKDPRTERRIRNKDRPALEIYRPGMGRYSKQRLEKVLGSSTERDTPSPSPSITSN
ncbi:uncharacterized protein Upf3 [Bemisia tabaci]